MIKEKIMVSVDTDGVFFHVFGDNRKYYDIDSLLLHRQELTDITMSNRYYLESHLLKKRESLGMARV